MMLPVRSFLASHAWWRLEPHRDWLLIEGRPCPSPTATDLTPPHCAAVSGQLYLVYIPRGNKSRSIGLTNVQTSNYQVAWYNPRTGEETPLSEALLGQSVWSVPGRPTPVDEDWVLLLRKP